VTILKVRSIFLLKNQFSMIKEGAMLEKTTISFVMTMLLLGVLTAHELDRQERLKKLKAGSNK